MARGLRTCESCGSQLDAVMERIIERAQKLEDEADHMPDVNTTWGRRVGGAAELRWAATLLMERSGSTA